MRQPRRFGKSRRQALGQITGWISPGPDLLPIGAGGGDLQHIGIALAPAGRQVQIEFAIAARRHAAGAARTPGQFAWLGRSVVRAGKAQQPPVETHLVQADEVVAVVHRQRAVEAGIERGSAQLDRRPDILDCVVAAFLLVVRTDDAVRAVSAIWVDAFGLVGADHAFVHQRPDHAARAHGRRHHRVPVVLQAGAAATVVQCVHEFGRHEQVGAAQAFVDQVPVRIVLGVEAVEDGPRMDDRALLRIVLAELRIEIGIEAALVAVGPEQDTRVVDIARHHLRHQLAADGGAVRGLPARQFVDHVQAQFVRCFEEGGIGRVVRHARRVHVHRFYKARVGVVVGAVEGAACRGPEAVAVDALDDDLAPVQVQAVALADFEGAETEAGTLRMQRLAAPAQGEAQRVEVGGFSGPQARRGQGAAQGDASAGGIRQHGAKHRPDRFAACIEYLAVHRGPRQRLRQIHVRGQRTIGSRVDRQGCNGLHRRRFQPHGTEDAAEDPVVAGPLGLFADRVGRHLVDIDFQQVVGVGGQFDQLGDVVAETVKAADVRRPGRPAVDPYRRLRHHAFEYQPDGAAAPGRRHGKLHPVLALLVVTLGAFTVIVASVSLQLPVRWHRYRRPGAGAATVGHLEVPWHRRCRPLAGQVALFGDGDGGMARGRDAGQ